MICKRKDGKRKDIYIYKTYLLKEATINDKKCAKHSLK
jgi:hypothetical protein